MSGNSDMNSDLTFKGGSSDGMFSVQDVKNQMKCTPAHEKEFNIADQTFNAFSLCGEYYYNEHN